MSRIFITLPILVLLLAVPALAANDPAVEWNQKLLQEFSSKAQTAEDILRNKDQIEWTQSEIDEYLFCSLLAVYYATNNYLLENNEHPGSPEQLKESGILPHWPANPFNNWEPITWTQGSTEFSAGNLCIQLCPTDWYSRPNPPRPITYVISIFGPSEDYTPLHEKETSPFDTMTWAIEPVGEAFSTGFFRKAAK